MRKLVLGLLGLCLTGTAFGAGEYGAPITLQKVRPLVTLLKSDAPTKGEEVLTQGRVENVCEKKGCWMMIKSGGEQVRVTFKGYKYFVPVSLRGKTVKIQGVIEEKTVSVDEQKHYLEDAGASEEEIAKITKPKKSFSIVATGVEVLPEKG